jgi:hypothetical protein
MENKQKCRILAKKSDKKCFWERKCEKIDACKKFNPNFFEKLVPKILGSSFFSEN